MAKTVENLEILQEYLSGVLNRADHHANNVNQIILAIVGGIIWKTTNKLIVMTREEEMKNVLWLEVNSKKLCFVYNHDSEKIDIRKSSIRGNTIESFDNNTSIVAVKLFFEKL